MELSEYSKKRNFSKTSEPKPKKETVKKFRFVIQRHKARATHFDLRLEHKGVLLSWAVPKGLSISPNEKRLAVMVEDHPVDYINFEGIIPKGNYGAGTVDIFDKGTYVQVYDFDKGLKKGHLKFFLNGDKLKGEWSLVKIDQKNWLVIKSKDEFAKIASKKIKNPFKKCEVQLATLTEKIPSGKNWIFEIKYDGYRAISYVENGKVEIVSRNNIQFNNLKNIEKSLKKIEENSFVVDGEIVSFDENGRSDFSLLQENLKRNKNNMFYVVFDLLALNGEDLRSLPLIERKNKLERLVYKTDKNIVYSSHVEKGKECFNFAKENNLEGIVAKKTNSIYSGKRTEAWLKIKCYKKQEFVICGFAQNENNTIFSSLLLGYYKNNELIFVGKVGTGFSEKLKEQLKQKFEKIISKKTYFNKNINEKNVTWLKPKLVAEIQFVELTKEKVLRQASFIGLRTDKNPKDVVLEDVWKALR